MISHQWSSYIFTSRSHNVFVKNLPDENFEILRWQDHFHLFLDFWLSKHVWHIVYDEIKLFYIIEQKK